VIVATGLLLVLAADAPNSAATDCPVTFTDVARTAGLGFVHDRGSTPEHRLPEMIGAGLAWLDYDNDGWMDLYAVQSGPTSPRRPASATRATAWAPSRRTTTTTDSWTCS
jgi:hypothetical protein